MGLIFGFGDPAYPMVAGTDYKITTVNAMIGKEAIAVFNSSYLSTIFSVLLKSLYCKYYIYTLLPFF